MRVAALLGLLAGCTLTGVGEDLEQATCAGEPASFCEELNALAPTDDDCQRWACDVARERPVCAVLPRDLDLDGAPARECAPSGVTPDCDDEDPARAPGQAEACDGVDNDCDQLVDDGAWAASAPRAVVAFGEAVEHVAVAAAPSGGALAAAVTFALRTGTGAGQPRAALLTSLAPELAATPLDVVAVVTPDDFDLLARATGAFVASSGDVIGLVAEPSGGAGSDGRLLAGVLAEGTGRADLEIDQLAHLTDGFAASAPSSHLAVAANPAHTGAVAAFLGHDASPTDGCGAIATTAQATAMTTTAGLARALTTVEVGAHTDPSPPAVLALDDDTFLVAIADGTSITVRLIALTAGEPVLGAVVHTEPTTAAAGQLALALDDDDRVALAWREGCAAAATLRLRVFGWTGAALTPANGAVELAPGGSATLLPEQPAIAAIAGGGWWIAWTRGDAAVVASRVDARGTPVEEVDVWTGAMVRFGLDVVAGAAAVDVLAYDEAGGHTLRASTLTCAAP